MNSLDKLFLSDYLIKLAGVTGSLARGAARGAGRGAARGAGRGAGKGMAQATTKLPPPSFLTEAEQLAQKRFNALSPGEKQYYLQSQLKKQVQNAAPKTPAQLPPPSFMTQQAAPALAAVAPAAAAAMPTGLGLARQGLGQVMTGTGQAIRSGVGAVRDRVSNAAAAAKNRLSSGVAATRAGLVSAAKNPLVQAGAVGLGGGALGAYGVNTAMGVGATPQPAPAPAAATMAPAAAPALTNTIPDYAAMDEEGVQMTPPVAAPAAPASVPAAATAPVSPAAAQATYDQQLAADEATAQEDAAMVNEPDYNQIFKRYMGSDYRGDSSLDRAKMQYLQSLHGQGRDLNASNIYNKSYGYGNW